MKQIKFFCNKCNTDITNKDRYHIDTRTTFITNDGQESEEVVSERDFCPDCMNRMVGLKTDENNSENAERG